MKRALVPARDGYAGSRRVPRCIDCLWVLCAAALLLPPQCAARTRTARPAHPSAITYPPFAWSVPSAEENRRELEGGGVLYVAPDHSLPMVTVMGSIQAGSLLDPPGKEGRAALLAHMLTAGGTREYHPDTLDMLLDLFAIRGSFAATENELTFSFSFLSVYTDTALHILAQMLCHPAFHAPRFETERSRFMEKARHRYDSPQPLLSDAQTYHLYHNQVNAVPASHASLGAIERDDLITAHREALVRPALIAGASGDIDADFVTSWFTATLAELPDSGLPPYPEVVWNPQPRTLVVHKPLTQAYVRMSLPLFQRPHPDFFAVTVLDMVLGGASFSSRLNEKIRSDAGLTYSIYSHALSNYFYPAPFFVQFHTRTETAVEAMGMTVAQIAAIAQDGITASELEHARKVLVDGLPSMFRGADDLVTHYIRNEHQGRDLDFFRQFAENVTSVTLEDVARVARIYADTSQLFFTIVADTSVLFASDTLPHFTLRSHAPLRVVPQDTIAGALQRP